jgi:S-adenosylmethionine:tRNA-ribosyltransferase-isomerase (queuine synthetase)
MTESHTQKGTIYVVGGRYGQSYVDRYINGQMHGNVIGGTTKKRAIEAANALNSAYRAGLNDAALFIKEQYETDKTA